ncbi:MAG: hypothetical protein J5586_02655 [Clostridia bacterium]|nr:hypothetical protein [Clostridia bacterium]
MRDIDDYTREVLQRADEKRRAIKTRRRRALSVCSGLAVFLIAGSFALKGIIGGFRSGADNAFEGHPHGAIGGIDTDSAYSGYSSLFYGGVLGPDNEITDPDSVKEAAELIESAVGKDIEGSNDNTSDSCGDEISIVLVSAEDGRHEYLLMSGGLRDARTGKFYPMDAEAITKLKTILGIEEKKD